MTTSGIETATLWFVVQCLNQRRYRVNSENLLYSKIVQIIKLWLLLCTITIILFFVGSFVYVMYLFVCAGFIIGLCTVKPEGSSL
jgi:hypothetical protein